VVQRDLDVSGFHVSSTWASTRTALRREFATKHSS
jgi:hypothetical protein